MADRHVNQDGPGTTQNQHRRKPDALYIGTHNQGRRNNSESHLETGEDDLRNRTAHHIRRHPGKESLAKPTDQTADARLRTYKRGITYLT